MGTWIIIMGIRSLKDEEEVVHYLVKAGKAGTLSLTGVSHILGFLSRPLEVLKGRLACDELIAKQHEF